MQRAYPARDPVFIIHEHRYVLETRQNVGRDVTQIIHKSSGGFKGKPLNRRQRLDIQGIERFLNLKLVNREMISGEGTGILARSAGDAAMSVTGTLRLSRTEEGALRTIGRDKGTI